ncbi:MAG: OsmC family protein [Gammaproteobacteria bacterium]|nr:OsmC family protein [Gammaproteobacteria bacterium]MDH5630857.1 OsmC family protein [Gammaproteobacteria bacterium]
MSAEHGFSVSLKLIENYQFMIDFGDFGQIVSDEPSPLGDGKGPNPMRLLAAGVANCLAASLMFAIRKFKGDPGEVSANITGNLERVDGRWRATKMKVAIQLGNDPANIEHLDRVLSQFEEFCIVTQSVRQGIDVDVSIADPAGNIIYGES